MTIDEGKERILVLVEKENGNIAPLTLELISAARGLSHMGDGLICACVMGYGINDIAEDLVHYADEIYLLDDALLSDFQSDLYASCLEKLCSAILPETIILGQTYDTIELAPKLACKLGTQLITDCVHIEREIEGGPLLCTKPVYGGNAVAVLEMNITPNMVTMRSKVTEAAEKSEKEGKLIPFDSAPNPSAALSELIEFIPGQSVSLDKADIIVAGGRGIKTTEGLQELENLVEVLRKIFGKVELGASRPLVDAGLVPHSRQIGQTGEKVTPQLYFAIAISGASQHLSGIVGSKKIVAINRDAEAPIFDVVDYGVVGSYEDIVPALVNILKGL